MLGRDLPTTDPYVPLYSFLTCFILPSIFSHSSHPLFSLFLLSIILSLFLFYSPFIRFLFPSVLLSFCPSFHPSFRPSVLVPLLFLPSSILSSVARPFLLPSVLSFFIGAFCATNQDGLFAKYDIQNSKLLC
jgi:hypothetical protein